MHLRSELAVAERQVGQLRQQIEQLEGSALELRAHQARGAKAVADAEHMQQRIAGESPREHVYVLDVYCSMKSIYEHTLLPMCSSMDAGMCTVQHMHTHLH